VAQTNGRYISISYWWSYTTIVTTHMSCMRPFVLLQTSRFCVSFLTSFICATVPLLCIGLKDTIDNDEWSFRSRCYWTSRFTIGPLQRCVGRWPGAQVQNKPFRGACFPLPKNCGLTSFSHACLRLNEAKGLGGRVLLGEKQVAYTCSVNAKYFRGVL
jgi:hypothetical protein